MTLDDVVRRATTLCDDHMTSMRALMQEASREGLDAELVAALVNVISVRVAVRHQSQQEPDPPNLQ